MVSKYPGEVSILALGPLTNFALAMKRDSSFARKVKRVVILGGSFFALGNVNPAAEANSLGVEAYTSWQGLNLKLCYNKARRRRIQVVSVPLQLFCTA
ncbi:uridine nucleosidase 1-like [Camellia sinensis]|uniref:uridine nucleosidase 1-like n=1 Tax=Camellia sinensis TaxID=4442 RepID=UPI0010365F7B|nr:uridine nucleosidase 1-like [Camellia sinensis]